MVEKITAVVASDGRGRDGLGRVWVNLLGWKECSGTWQVFELQGYSVCQNSVNATLKICTSHYNEILNSS